MTYYVEMAQNAGYSVLIMNPNRLNDKKTGQKITEFYDHYTHCAYIWEEFITKNEIFKNIIIVSHQTASISVIKLMMAYRIYIMY